MSTRTCLTCCNDACPQYGSDSHPLDENCWDGEPWPDDEDVLDLVNQLIVDLSHVRVQNEQLEERVIKLEQFMARLQMVICAANEPGDRP